MDEQMIRKYAGLMRELGLTGMEFRENGSLARLERMGSAPLSHLCAAESVPEQGAEALAGAPPVQSAGGPIVEVTSPMVGVFYRAPAENAAPFVQVGDRVKQGDVLCIIEAMKLMNELVADEDGVVEEICVENGQIVDFGKPLFRLRKEQR